MQPLNARNTSPDAFTWHPTVQINFSGPAAPSAFRFRVRMGFTISWYMLGYLYAARISSGLPYKITCISDEPHNPIRRHPHPMPCLCGPQGLAMSPEKFLPPIKVTLVTPV